MSANVSIRRLLAEDAAVISAAVQPHGWSRDADEYEEYARQEARGARACFVAEADSEFAGYCTLLWASAYPPFREADIPEVSDLVVLPPHRSQGIGRQLLDAVEAEAATRSTHIGLGVGLYAAYGAAQRLYVKRGYVPDGRGIMYEHEAVTPGRAVRIDDEALLMFVRTL